MQAFGLAAREQGKKKKRREKEKKKGTVGERLEQKASEREEEKPALTALII